MPQLEEVTVTDLKHLLSDRAATGETVMLNMGPQHPYTPFLEIGGCHGSYPSWPRVALAHEPPAHH